MAQGIRKWFRATACLQAVFNRVPPGKELSTQLSTMWSLCSLWFKNKAMNEQYAELAELAGGFVHEIKNHLGTLGLNLELLAEDFQDPQTQRERRACKRVEKLRNQCQALTEISNEFLRFARISNIEGSPCDLSKVVEEMIDFVTPTAESANIDIKSYLSANLPSVRLDVDLFKQALLNLMLNAEQAMPEGGELTIQANRENPTADFSVVSVHNAPTQYVALHLIDTGKGIPKDVQAKIFRPFFSTKQGGNGLGLPITKRIVEAHGGTLEMQSEPGHGTKFTIRLPACP